MRLGIVITRAGIVDETWTTIALAATALERGHSVRIIERADFEIDVEGRLVARAFAFESGEISATDLAQRLRRRVAERRFVDVGTLDLLLLRSSPLVPDLLTFARLARDRGVQVVNDPDGLALVTSKAWLASLADVPSPATLITRSAGAASVFYRQQPAGVVVKPARGSGGRAVSLVSRGEARRFDAAFTSARRNGGHVVVQAYLPAADHGEKRLLWLDGRILGGYLRRRAPGEFRHNLKQGGIAESAEVTDAERTLLAPLAPHLLGAGVHFAGLDLIGHHLVEINALNPGGTFHTDRLTGSFHARSVVEHLENLGAAGATETHHGLSPPPEQEAGPGRPRQGR